MPDPVRVFAPAKINLALHVTGQRADGYHLLDTLVNFASIGDILTVSAQGDPGLTVHGTFARDVPTDDSNSILAVAGAFQEAAPLAFTLLKELPVASGIGGGSADAAACYRALSMRAGRTPQSDDADRLLSLGADVPMCVACAPARVQGIGEEIKAVPSLPDLPIVLVNPGVAVSTPAIFKALSQKNNPPMTAMPSDIGNRARFLTWLADQRNDLQPAACEAFPVLHRVLAALRETAGCDLARMSGSGATCFGLYPTHAAAAQAAQEIKARQPQWWVQAGRLNGHALAAPQVIRSTT